MVTTLHLDHAGNVDCFGHNLGNAGQLLDFGNQLTVQNLKVLIRKAPQDYIWAPCSGGALYRVAALRKAQERIGG